MSYYRSDDEATGRTLSDPGEDDAPTRRSRRGLRNSARFAPDPRSKRQAGQDVRYCEHPHCWASADYLIPEGTTRRTRTLALYLCVDCAADYLERLKRSIVLPGEGCEWRTTLEALENIYDGGHDYLRDLLIEHCEHPACADVRAEAPTAQEVHDAAS